MSMVAPLASFTRADLASAGGKGANLGEMIRAGFPVPRGVVVTTDAYRLYLDHHGLTEQLAELAANPLGLDAEAARALFTKPVPVAIVEQISTAISGLTMPVTVRSSATAEDLPDASFAGQQETFLNIRGYAEVADTVRRCWASLWTDRAVAYRKQQGIDPDEVALAVVIQEMVPADAAGVLFTANPANGLRNEAILNATWGLGEALVSGTVSPDTMLVRDGQLAELQLGSKEVATVSLAQGTEEQPTSKQQRQAQVLTAAEAHQLVQLGDRVAAHFGVPMDIEWTRHNDRFQLVQARPITALPEPTGPTPTDWSVPDQSAMYARASIIEQMPDPLSPLFADMIRPAVKSSLTKVLSSYFGQQMINPDDIDFPTIHGYPYYYYTAAGMKRLLRLTPRALPTVYGTSEKGGEHLWRDIQHPAYQRVTGEWKAKDATALPAVDLLTGVRTLVQAGSDYYTSVQTVIPTAATSEITFTKFYNAVCRTKTSPDAPVFLLGEDSAPIRAEKSLWDLAEWVKTKPELKQAIVDGTEIPAAVEAEWTQRLQAHLDHYGHAIYNLDFMVPVPADDPAPVIETLRFYFSGLGTNPHVRQQQQLHTRDEAVKELMGRLDPVRRNTVQKMLAKAHRFGPMREDALADVGLAWPTIRVLLRELGQRLVDAGAIDERDDVFWLTAAEADAAASTLDAGGSLVGHADMVEQRKLTWRGQRNANPPGLLPKNVWAKIFQRWMPSVEQEQTGPTLSGLAASGGSVTAVARVLTDSADFGAMRPGEILVAPITTPAYTPFFAMAAGVVTDIGGPLSHSSIVAREYGIPAVLGTGSATRRIKTGDLITVDGTTGTVRLADSASTRSTALEKRLPEWAPAATLAGGVGALGGAIALARLLKPKKA